MAYIYKFLNKENEVIYVGHTQNLNNRLKQHFGDSGHLDKAIYDEVEVVEYAEKESVNEVRIYELYYISKYKPKYNTLLLEESTMTLSLPELNFHSLKVDELKKIEFTNYNNVVNSIKKDLKNIEFFINWIVSNCKFNGNELGNYTNLTKEDIDFLELKNKVLLESKEDILLAINRIKNLLGNILTK